MSEQRVTAWTLRSFTERPTIPFTNPTPLVLKPPVSDVRSWMPAELPVPTKPTGYGEV